MLIQDSIIANNTAVVSGGGIRQNFGTAIITRSVISWNIQTQTTGATISQGGGGMSVVAAAVVTVRESTFENNEAATNNGHQILTYKVVSGTPAVTVVNTIFDNSDVSGGTDFYLYDNDNTGNSGAAAYYSLTEKNCADGSYCTEAPYTGACTDVAQGMTCASTACAENEYVSSNVCTACPVGMGNVAGDDVSGVDTTCDTICTLGQYDNSGTCTNCPLTQFSSTTTATACSDLSTCAAGQYVSQAASGTAYVNKIFSTRSAFAALKNDKSVQAWGDEDGGGCDSGSGTTSYSCKPANLTNVKTIVSTFHAYAALKNDGSVATWGESSSGGCDSGSGTTGVYSCKPALTNVQTIFSNNYAFAALKTDGSVVAWGRLGYGGCDSGSGDNDYSCKPSDLTNVKTIFSNYNAFAALKTDGSVVAWGNGADGGTVPSGLTNVQTIFSTYYAFAALKDDGSVQVWGVSSYGGTGTAPLSVTAADSGVQTIFSTSKAFAALKTDGSVIAWGDESKGGCDSGSGTTSYWCKPADLTNVTTIVSTESAFAALKTDGSVVVWGANYNADAAATLEGVTDIFSTAYAVAALKTDGSVVTWGQWSYGGTGNTPLSVTAANSGVQTIFSNFHAFAAVKSDGSVVAWGNAAYGGDASGVTLTNVQTIFSNDYAFAALKTDGSVIAWGHASNGGADPGIGAGFYTSDRTCADCATGTHTTTDNADACAINQCTCAANGAGATGAACDIDGSTVKCASCVTGYHLDADACAINQCTCAANGAGATGAACDIDGTAQCASCVTGHHLDTNNACAINCHFTQFSSTTTACSDLSTCAAVDSKYVSQAASNTLVQTIFSTPQAFAAVKGDGSVVAWGNSLYGGDASGVTLTNVETIVTTRQAFAALNTDGSVQAWGDSSYGGDASGVNLTNVQSIFSAESAFAALKTDGSVVAWGASLSGGSIPSTVDVSSDVQTIYSTALAFAALKTDGSVQAWGDSYHGGADPGITSGVVTIFSTTSAFAALKDDGSVVAWGHSSYGGTDPGITSGVVSIFSTDQAFAALKTDGRVVAWGYSYHGGADPGITSGVVTVFSTSGAFAALKTDGSVVAWGSSNYGGTDPGITSGVQTIFSTQYAFAALKTDGSVQAWGSSNYGGTDPGITSGVVTIFSTTSAFAALKDDGSVVAWGLESPGGCDSGSGYDPSAADTVFLDILIVESSYPEEITWEIKNSADAVVYTGTGNTDDMINQPFLRSESYTFIGGDTYGDGWNGGFVELKYTGGGSQFIEVEMLSGSSMTEAFNLPPAIVIDPNATNCYKPADLTNVKTIFSNFHAFAALKDDGSVQAWGHSSYGGCNSGSGTTSYSCKPADLTNVTTIFSAESAFAAVKTDGSVVTWGHASTGGADPGIGAGFYTSDRTCAACAAGYHTTTDNADADACVINQCVCTNGVAVADGAACPAPGDEECISCVTGYHLDTNNACAAINQCPVSAPANGALGDCVSPLADGATCVPTCNEGLMLSGINSCTTGTLTAAECIPYPSYPSDCLSGQVCGSGVCGTPANAIKCGWSGCDCNSVDPDCQRLKAAAAAAAANNVCIEDCDQATYDAKPYGKREYCPCFQNFDIKGLNYIKVKVNGASTYNSHANYATIAKVKTTYTNFQSEYNTGKAHPVSIDNVDASSGSFIFPIDCTKTEMEEFCLSTMNSCKVFEQSDEDFAVLHHELLKSNGDPINPVITNPNDINDIWWTAAEASTVYTNLLGLDENLDPLAPTVAWAPDDDDFMEDFDIPYDALVAAGTNTAADLATWQGGADAFDAGTLFECICTSAGVCL